MTLGDLLQTAATTLPYWQRPVVFALLLFVLGCFTFVAAAWGEE